MKSGVRYALMFGLGLVGPLAAAHAEGDSLRGKELAREWCAACHDVEPGGQMQQKPPAFAAIAAFRSPHYIHANIAMPHGNMPEIAQILGLNIDDLVAYITSLEQPCF